eukprot:2528954-Amphidinium_carterae.1
MLASNSDLYNCDLRLHLRELLPSTGNHALPRPPTDLQDLHWGGVGVDPGMKSDFDRSSASSRLGIRFRRLLSDLKKASELSLRWPQSAQRFACLKPARAID